MQAVSLPLGVFSGASLDNATFFGTGGHGPSTTFFERPGAGPASGGSGIKGPHCLDLNGRGISQGVHYVPGPDECTLCICDDGVPKWCKAVLCAPPQDCKSFRVGTSCCDFICLDDSLGKGRGVKTGGPYGYSPVDVSDVVPKIVIAAVTAMLSLSLLFFLVHRLRQREMRGRMNSAEARRSRQMCDECDDTRSLDFSMYDFDRSPIPNSHLFPPQYMAWWKPPSSYFPPSEAPPPYEEAMASTSHAVPPFLPATVNTNLLPSNTTILTNENINHPDGSNNPVSASAGPSAPSEEMSNDNAEPIPGPSTTATYRTELTGTRTEPKFESSPSTTVLPTYSVVALAGGRDCFRHSLTLPRRPNLQEMQEFGLDLNGTGADAAYFQRSQQRYSLQLNVVDWSSSSSSTISITPSTPMTPMGIGNPSLSSSSSSCSSNNTHS